MLWHFLSATFDSLSKFEVFLLVAGAGLALGWNKLESWTRLAVLVTLLVLGVLLLDIGISRSAADHIKVLIAAGALALALAWRSLPRQSAFVALMVLTLVAALNYMRWGHRYLAGHRVNSYDLLHYYMSARYFEEVGYYDLYPALALADREREEGPRSAMGSTRSCRCARRSIGVVRSAKISAMSAGRPSRMTSFTSSAQ